VELDALAIMVLYLLGMLLLYNRGLIGWEAARRHLRRRACKICVGKRDGPHRPRSPCVLV